MHETKTLIQTLKRLLKEKHLKYRDLAKHLNLSEASIKRLFSQEDLSLSRLEQILSAMDLRLVDLFKLLDTQKEYVSQLTLDQETTLLQNPKLLLIFFLLLNAWPLEAIPHYFAIDPHEMIRLLAKLDKLRLIELLPHNKVKLLTASNFTWPKNGPVQKFFEEQVLKDFFKSDFSTQDTKLIFLGGMLAESSLEKLKNMLEEFALKVNHMLKEDLKLPLEKRFSTGIVLATRRWELDLFTQLRRKSSTKDNKKS